MLSPSGSAPLESHRDGGECRVRKTLGCVRIIGIRQEPDGRGRVPDGKCLYGTPRINCLAQTLQPLIIAVKCTIVVPVPEREGQHPHDALFGQTRKTVVDGAHDNGEFPEERIERKENGGVIPGHPGIAQRVRNG